MRMTASVWVQLQAFADGPTTFGAQSHYRAEAREAFVRGDCGERVRRAALRKAAPVVGSYQVGDIVSSCREARAGEHGKQWSVGSRLIVFEKDRNSLGDTQPTHVLGNLRSRARLCCHRSVTTVHASGIIGFSSHANEKFFTSCSADAQTQQGFIDGRASFKPTTADPSRTADEGEDEDERDDEMSEPTQITKKTEKRKEDSDGRNSKRVMGIVTHN